MSHSRSSSLILQIAASGLVYLLVYRILHSTDEACCQLGTDRLTTGDHSLFSEYINVSLEECGEDMLIPDHVDSSWPTMMAAGCI